MNDIITKEASKITKTYKIDYEDVVNRIENKLSKYPNLINLIGTSDYHHIEKSKDFKNALKEVKKEIYYDLRQYRQINSPEKTNKTIEELDKAIEENDLGKIISLFAEAVKDHVSTNERTEHIQHFHSQFEDLIKESKIILDIGGGLYPLTFPFENALSLNQYVWVDTDLKSFQILSTFKKFLDLSKGLAKPSKRTPSIILFNESFEKRKWSEYYEQEPNLVLMLKLVPVIWRQQRNLINKLATIRGKNILITANKEALTKKVNIKARENNILQKFIELSGRTIIREIDIQTEFGYILK